MELKLNLTPKTIKLIGWLESALILFAAGSNWLQVAGVMVVFFGAGFLVARLRSSAAVAVAAVVPTPHKYPPAC